MTRGTFVLITKDKVFTSVEFNWDMYPWIDWFWDEALILLWKVKSEKDFKKMVFDFNKSHHNYNDNEINFEIDKEAIRDWFDFNYKYFWDSKQNNEFMWFSDYLFFKNLADKPIQFWMRTNLEEVQSFYENSEEKLKELNHNYQNSSIVYNLNPNETVRFHFWMIEEVDSHIYLDNLMICSK